MFINGKLIVCGVACQEDKFLSGRFDDEDEEALQVVYGDVFDIANQWLRDETDGRQQVLPKQFQALTSILFVPISVSRLPLRSRSSTLRCLFGWL